MLRVGLPLQTISFVLEYSSEYHSDYFSTR